MNSVKSLGVVCFNRNYSAGWSVWIRGKWLVVEVELVIVLFEMLLCYGVMCYVLVCNFYVFVLGSCWLDISYSVFIICS